MKRTVILQKKIRTICKERGRNKCSNFELGFLYLTRQKTQAPVRVASIFNEVKTKKGNSKMYIYFFVVSKQSLVAGFIMFLLLSANLLRSQQQPIYYQFDRVQGLLNPASIRTDFHLNQRDYTTFTGISSRHHWLNLQDRNRTQSIQFEKILPNNGVAFYFGGQLINDKNGRIANTGVYGRIGAIINNDLDWGGLSLGLNMGLVQYRLDLRNIRAREGGDILTNVVVPKFYPDIGLGAYFFKMIGVNGNDIFHVGLSIPSVFKLDVNQKEHLNFLSPKSHHYLEIGYTHAQNDAYSFWDISTQMSYVKNAPLFFGIKAKHQWKRLLWLGLGYASNGVIQPEVGLILGDAKLYKLGAAFDVPLNEQGAKFGNSFEVNLVMAFGN